MAHAITYDYPIDRQWDKTIATVDGRRYAVCPPVKGVYPLGEHADGCAQVTQIGGRCDCGLLEGVDVDAVIADARLNGCFGAAPRAPRRPAVDEPLRNDPNLCPVCESYCYGDCRG